MADPRIPRVASLTAFAFLAAVWLYSSSAQTPSQPVRPASLSPGGLSMDQAVKMAEQRFKARVVRAEAQKDGGRTIYVLRLLNESGRVWTVRVNASNGAVL